MRVLKIAAVSLGLMLASPGLAVAQEAFVAGAITGALTGGLTGGPLGQPLVDWQVRQSGEQRRPTTPGGRLSGLLRTWAVCLKRLHHRSAQLSLTPPAPLVLTPLRARFPLSSRGFSGSSLRRL